MGLRTNCRLASWPTNNSDSFVKPTTDGVVLAPSALAITTGLPASTPPSSKNILKKINNSNTLFETLLISANDELVDQYINNKIKFFEINKILIKILSYKKYSKLNKKKPKKISDIINLSEEVRLKTRQLCIG